MLNYCTFPVTQILSFGLTNKEYDQYQTDNWKSVLEASLFLLLLQLNINDLCQDLWGIYDVQKGLKKKGTLTFRHQV